MFIKFHKIYASMLGSNVYIAVRYIIKLSFC